MSTTIRVNVRTKARLAALAKAMGRPMTEVLEDAVGALERQVFFDRLNVRFREHRGDREAWHEVEEERAVEERSLADGEE